LGSEKTMCLRFASPNSPEKEGQVVTKFFATEVGYITKRKEKLPLPGGGEGHARKRMFLAGNGRGGGQKLGCHRERKYSSRGKIRRPPRCFRLDREDTRRGVRLLGVKRGGPKETRRGSRSETRKEKQGKERKTFNYLVS